MSSDKSCSGKNDAVVDKSTGLQAQDCSSKPVSSGKTLNLSAKEFVSRGPMAHSSSRSPSSSLAPRMMIPSPTYTSQSWIVDNLRSLISSHQDDEASEGDENEMPHGSSSTMASGAKMLKTDHGRSPMQSMGNFEVDEIERARRDRFESRFHHAQSRQQVSSRDPRELGMSHGGAMRAFETELESQNDLGGYAGGSYFEDKFSKRPFSPDEIHELTPHQQLRYQIQQEQQLQKQQQQQQSFYFQHADGLDYDPDMSTLTDFYQNSADQRHHLGMDSGQVMRKNLFRSSSSSKLPNQMGTIDTNVVRLAERKQKSLMRLGSEAPLPSSSSAGGINQMEYLNPSTGRQRMPNKSPSDNNLLAYFKKQNNELESNWSSGGQFSSRASSGCPPNIFVSQASNVPEFVPKSARQFQPRQQIDLEGVNDFNNNVLSGGADLDSSGLLLGEQSFNPYANRHNLPPTYPPQRMQLSRQSLIPGSGAQVPLSQHRYSMANPLDAELMTMGAQSGHHGLRKMAKSSSSLAYQGDNPYAGRQHFGGHLNDSDIASSSFMSASTNLDDSMFGAYQHHQGQQQWRQANRKWMPINQQQGYHQHHQMMNQQQSREGFRSSMSMMDQGGEDMGAESQQQQQQHQQDQKDPIVLHVKNLDYKISADEWKRILLENFRKHCKEIISVSVLTNADKSLLGVVKLGTKEDTRLAISCLHHKKIGYKRLNVQIASSSSSNSPKSKVVALLKSSGADNAEMPLTRFIESFESRYNQSISISELFKLKDTVHISHGRDGQGRQIKLIGNKNYQYNLENEMQELLHTPFCSLHSSQKHDEFSMKEMASAKAGSASTDSAGMSYSHQSGFGWLPNVVVSLRTFKSAVHKLLNDHGGQMCLLSFMDCYRCCIYNDAANPASVASAGSAKTEMASDQDAGGQVSYQLMIDNENGVPLEHLITCAQDVQIQFNEGFYKQLQWENDKSKSANLQSRNNNPSTSSLCALLNSTSNKGGRAFEMMSELSGGGVGGFDEETMMEESQRKLNMFSHEVVELFKCVPRCVIAVSKFNSEYNKKYGRQCRVADYGFTKLFELLESIPHIVQILDGEYEKKLTLTHRIQVRRFSNDLLKVLKGHAAKQMFADEYPSAYEKHFGGRAFDIRDYGVCFLEDMLAELPDTIVCRKEIEGRTFIQIPRVVQMDEEILCTRRLANDVVDMLKHKPRFSIQFNKFIPNYHHHFGRQCKLSNYGFTKLVELLEAMPSVVQLLVKDGLQFVQLKPHLMIELICQNMVKLIEDAVGSKLAVSLAKLEELYNSKFEAVFFKDLECSSFVELFKKLPFEKHFIQVSAQLPDDHSNNGQMVEVDLVAKKQAFFLTDDSTELTLQVDAINESLVKRVARLTLKRLIDDEMDNYLANHLQATAAASGKSLISFDELVQLLFFSNTASQSEMDIAGVVSKLQQLNKREYNYLLKLLSDYLQTVSPPGSDQQGPLSAQDNIIGFSDVYYFSKQIRIIFKQINILEMSFADLEMVYKQAMGVTTSMLSSSQHQSSSLSGFPYKRLGFIDAFLLFSQGISLLVSVKKFDNDKSVVLNKEFWPKVFDTNPLCLAESLSNPMSPIKIDLSLSGLNQSKSPNLSDSNVQSQLAFDSQNNISSSSTSSKASL